MILAVCAPLPGTGAGQKLAKAQAADSPEAAVKLLVAAAKADDVHGFLAQLGGHTRAMMEMAMAMEAYDKALDEKFGKKAGAGGGLSVISELARFKTNKIEIRSQAPKGKDRVALTIWQTSKTDKGEDYIKEETWLTIKEATGWKIILPEKGIVKEATRKGPDGAELKVRVLTSREVSDDESAALQKFMASAARILNTVAADVKAGNLQTRKDAEAALQKAKDSLPDK
jgi:hypothetical protein